MTRTLLRSVPLVACGALLAACASFGGKPVCRSCGTVVSIRANDATHASSGGAVLGGIVGGVAASRPSAPAPSAPTGYDIRVRMDDGHEVSVHQSDAAGLRRNAPVRVINGRVVAATTVTAKPQP